MASPYKSSRSRSWRNTLLLSSIIFSTTFTNAWCDTWLNLWAHLEINGSRSKSSDISQQYMCVLCKITLLIFRILVWNLYSRCSHKGLVEWNLSPGTQANEDKKWNVFKFWRPLLIYSSSVQLEQTRIRPLQKQVSYTTCMNYQRKSGNSYLDAKISCSKKCWKHFPHRWR